MLFFPSENLRSSVIGFRRSVPGYVRTTGMQCASNDIHWNRVLLFGCFYLVEQIESYVTPLRNVKYDMDDFPVLIATNNDDDDNHISKRSGGALCGLSRLETNTDIVF